MKVDNEKYIRSLVGHIPMHRPVAVLIIFKDNKVLFVKFMDTSEEIFSILDEELIEVMNEEFNLLRLKMAQHHKNISYNFCIWFIS